MTEVLVFERNTKYYLGKHSIRLNKKPMEWTLWNRVKKADNNNHLNHFHMADWSRCIYTIEVNDWVTLR